MRHIVGSIEGEYRRYRKLGSDAMAQLTALQLAAQPSPESNSIATIVWHVSGNLTSRFTDFLTEDGEKPWREREEFAARQVEPAELSAKWDRGWEVLMAALDELTDMDLERTVRIRGVDLTVTEALHRSLAVRTHGCRDVEEGGGVGDVVVKNQDPTRLFDHEQAIVSRCREEDRGAQSFDHELEGFARGIRGDRLRATARNDGHQRGEGHPSGIHVHSPVRALSCCSFRLSMPSTSLPNEFSPRWPPCGNTSF